jgi:PKHD-type hydroxylase
MVRDDGKRGMLFDLDTQIQKLRAQHGESEITVGLTAHYHNLLRMWAEV